MTMQVLGRMTPSDTESIAFYWRNVWGDYALSFPFAFLVTLAYLPRLCRPTHNKRILLIRYLVIWTLIILIGMSIPGGKKTRYILAISPAISLVAAYLFIAQDQPTWLRWFRRAVVWFFFFFPFIGAMITMLARNYAYHRGLHLDILINYTYIFIWLALLS